MITAALFTEAELKTHEVSTSGELHKEMWYVYTRELIQAIFSSMFLIFKFFCFICFKDLFICIGSSRAGVIGGYKPADVDAGNQILVLWKSNKNSEPMSHLSSVPGFVYFMLLLLYVYFMYLNIFKRFYIDMC